MTPRAEKDYQDFLYKELDKSVSLNSKQKDLNEERLPVLNVSDLERFGFQINYYDQQGAPLVSAVKSSTEPCSTSSSMLRRYV
jgi:hypothetical protein